VALSEAEWTSLGSGSALVGAYGGDLLLVSAATQPSRENQLQALFARAAAE
jgi:hypothetical protein